MYTNEEKTLRSAVFQCKSLLFLRWSWLIFLDVLLQRMKVPQVWAAHGSARLSHTSTSDLHHWYLHHWSPASLVPASLVPASLVPARNRKAEREIITGGKGRMTRTETKDSIILNIAYCSLRSLSSFEMGVRDVCCVRLGSNYGK